MYISLNLDTYKDWEITLCVFVLSRGSRKASFVALEETSDLDANFSSVSAVMFVSLITADFDMVLFALVSLDLL